MPKRAYMDVFTAFSGRYTFAPPTSTLPTQISIDGGYLKLDVLADGGPPSASDCNTTSHEGRLIVSSALDALYLCTQSGWIALVSSF